MLVPSENSMRIEPASPVTICSLGNTLSPTCKMRSVPSTAIALTTPDTTFTIPELAMMLPSIEELNYYLKCYWLLPTII